MKKILCLLLLLSLVLGLSINASVSADEIPFDNKVTTVYNASYQVTKRLMDDSLSYGLHHYKDLAQSKTSQLIISGTSEGNMGQYDPQQVNILEVPVNSSARIVSWNYSSSNAWSCQTVTALAKDFEQNNPGWIVLAAINADFFDINSNRALPKQTNGVCVNNGEVVRASSSGTQVGFTNDGTTNSLVGNEQWSVTSYHVLTIYDENDQVIGAINVDKFNEAPVGDEVSVYFSNYYHDTNKVRQINYQTCPSENSYLVEAPIRGYADGPNHLYANGVISSINKEKQLQIGEFVVVTTNDISNKLNIGTRIRIQQEVTGAYENCDNVTGCGDTLLKNGEAPANFETDTDFRHPRTIVGRKADGTIVMAVVDGRQTAIGMYGAAKDEMSAIMSHYGCVEAYNLDGGGSTTMIIRNEQGGFDVQNSPSDGSERSDSNALLVVVPELKINVDSATSDSVTVSYLAPSNEISVSNVQLKITGEGFSKSYPMDGLSITVDELASCKDYVVSCTYDLTYNDKTSSLESSKLNFSTGYPAPTVSECYYKLVDGYYEFYFKIEDPNNTISICSINYDKSTKFINKSNTSASILESKVKNPVFTLELNFNVSATPNKADKVLYEFKEYVPPIDDNDDPEVDPTPTPDADTKKKCGKKSAELVMSLIAATSILSIILRKKH